MKTFATTLLACGALAAQGAVPVLRNDRVIGAIGCSGGAPQQDETAAKAGGATF